MPMVVVGGRVTLGRGMTSSASKILDATRLGFRGPVRSRTGESRRVCFLLSLWFLDSIHCSPFHGFSSFLRLCYTQILNMKRATLDNSPGANKRLKQDKEAEKTDWPTDDSGPFRASLQRKATDIPTHGVDDTGFIQAKIMMKWPVVQGRVRLEVSVSEDAVAKHFYVVFSGPCPAFFNSIGLKFAIGDSIRLSLQDVTVEQVTAGHSKFLPMQLHYDRGVRMQVLGKKASVATLVDYWQGKLSFGSR